MDGKVASGSRGSKPAKISEDQKHTEKTATSIPTTVQQPRTEEKNEDIQEFKRVYLPKFLWSWGLNNYGQLGRPRSNLPCVLPKMVPIDSEVFPACVRQIVIGTMNTYVLTDSGEVFGNGLNNIRQVGYGDYLNHKFQKLDILDEFCIQHIAVHSDTCYAATKRGIALGWGSNAFGQLGKNPAVLVSSLKPIELYSESTVIQVGAGQRHCVILTQKGRVLTCGDNRNAQLGRTCDINDFAPKEIDTLRNVRQIAVGQHHNLALCKHKGEMKLFAWGYNIDGQCGDNPTTQSQIAIPFEITLGVTIHKGAIIKCGWRHSGIMLPDGELYLWGDNKLGQHGTERPDTEPIPKRIKELSNEPLKDFDLGMGNTVVVLKSGMVLAFGDNVDGSCGIGHNNSPVRLPLKTCVGIRRVSTRVFVGYRQCFALTV